MIKFATCRQRVNVSIERLLLGQADITTCHLLRLSRPTVNTNNIYPKVKINTKLHFTELIENRMSTNSLPPSVLGFPLTFSFAGHHVSLGLEFRSH